MRQEQAARNVIDGLGGATLGEGGYTRQIIDGQGSRGSGTSSFLIPNEHIRGVLDAAGFTTEQVDQYRAYLNQPLYAGDMAQIVAESAYLGQWGSMTPEERELATAFATWQNSPLSSPALAFQQFGGDPDYQAEQAKFSPGVYVPTGGHDTLYAALGGASDLIGSGLDLAWNGSLGPLPSLRDVTSTVAGTAWQRVAWAGNRGVPGTDRSVANTAFAALDIPVRTVEELAYIAITSAGEVIRGENPEIKSFSDFTRVLAEKNTNFNAWRADNWSYLLVPEIIGDPLNLVTGAGLTRPFRAATATGKARVVGRTFGQLVSDGTISPEEMRRLADINPSWLDILNLHRAPERLAKELRIRIPKTGPDAVLFDAFSKRLALSLTIGKAYATDPATIYRHEVKKMADRIRAERGDAAAKRFVHQSRVTEGLLSNTLDFITTNETPAVIAATSKHIEQQGVSVGTPPAPVMLPSLDDAVQITDGVVDRTVTTLSELFSGDPLPPLTATLPEALDASGAQFRLLTFFGQRDGVNYLDGLVQGGDLSSAAVSRTITEINARGLATVGQLGELLRMGREWDEVRAIARQPRQQAQTHIDQVKGLTPIPDLDTRGYLSGDEFRTRHASRIGSSRAIPGDMDTRITGAQVSLAADRSHTYGVDLLRWLANTPTMTRKQFGQVISVNTLPASPAQLRYVRGLIERGTLDRRTVDFDNLRAAQADRLIKRGDDLDVTLAMNHDLHIPAETGRQVDIDRLADAHARVSFRGTVRAMLRKHLPRADGTVDDGLDVPPMPPEMLQHLLATNRTALAGTRFANAADELGALLLRGGDSSTSDAWDHALRGLLDDVAMAPDHETAILWKIVNDGYYARTVDDAGQNAKAAEDVNPDRKATAAAKRRDRRVRLERELTDVTRKINLRLMEQGGPVNLDNLRERKRELDDALAALNRSSYNDVQPPPVQQARGTNTDAIIERLSADWHRRNPDPHAKRHSLYAEVAGALDISADGDAAKHVYLDWAYRRQQSSTQPSTRQVQQEATAARVQQIIPTMGPRPANDAPPSEAASASNHDIAGMILNRPATRETPARVGFEPKSPEQTLRNWVDDVSLGGGVPETIPLHVRQAAVAAGLGGSDQPLSLLRDIVSEFNIRPTGRAASEGMARIGLATGADAIVTLAQRVASGTYRRTAAPVIDLTADAWSNVDWSTYGPRLQAYADHYYDTAGILDDERRIKVLGKRLNPTALTNMSRVHKVGDLFAADVLRLMDEAYTQNDPYEFVRETISQRMELLSTGRVKEIEDVDEFYTTFKEGREMLRLWREYGGHVLNRFEHATPHSSLGDLIEDGILPEAVNGRWAGNDLARLDAILNRRHRPRLSAAASHQLSNFIGAYSETWNTVIKPTVYDATTDTWADDVDILNRLDPLFFTDEAEDVVDLPKLADRIGSMVARKYADDIGFDPEDIPPMLRLMQTVKGNFTPLWMTI